MKGTVHQEEISTLKIYAPKNPGVSIYIKKKNCNDPKSTDRP
jgi:hypothetical protein